jgi:hypothetical protein
MVDCQHRRNIANAVSLIDPDKRRWLMPAAISPCLESPAGAQIPIRRRSGRFIALTSRQRGARSCWNDGSGGPLLLRLPVLAIAAIFRPKVLLIAEKPLSAATVGCAAAASSAASLERRRSALLDPGKPMVLRLASSVADCETANSSELAASWLEGVL